MNNLQKQYQELIQKLLDFGFDTKDDSGSKTKSIFAYTIRHDMSKGFPVVDTNKLVWKSIVVELLWLLNGYSDLKYFLEKDCDNLNDISYKIYLKSYESLPQIYGKEHKKLTLEEFLIKIKNDNNFHKTYGYLELNSGQQWRSWKSYENYDVTRYKVKSIDQIKNLIIDLKKNPDSGNMIVLSWNVGELNEMILTPASYAFQVCTRELSSQERKNIYDNSDHVDDVFPTDENGWNSLFDDNKIPNRAISLLWNQCTVDVLNVLPKIISSYGLLLEIIAKEVNMVPDELICNIGKAYIHSDDLESANYKEMFFTLPKLKIDTDGWKSSTKEKIDIYRSIKFEDFTFLDNKFNSA